MSARRRIAAGRPETHIGSVDEIEPGDRVLTLARVSTTAQDHRGNLAEQADDLRRAVEARGGTVVEAAAVVGSGQTPAALAPVLDAARRLGAKVLARDVSRLARHLGYRGKLDDYAAPGHAALMELLDAAGGVRLLTLVDPAAPPAAERGAQVRAGQAAKENRGGRPRKPARRTGPRGWGWTETYRAEALDLHAAGAGGRRKVTVELKARHGADAPSERTVGEWIRRGRG